MNEDTALFKYELAIVAILKNEAPYIKEWIDYHLLAGVDHFYICNNDSEDNLIEILQPYIDKGIIDLAEISGSHAQNIYYYEALKNYKFQCKYMIFLDADEFIQPRNEQSIKEVLNDILQDVPEAEGLTINWQMFNSYGHEKADFSRGVTERFLYRNVKPSNHVKTIFNPRCVDIALVHYPLFYEGKFAIYEDYRMGYTYIFEKIPASVDKIRINHYHFKSREEYIKKVERNRIGFNSSIDIKYFDNQEKADTIFDDSILHYIEARKLTGGGVLETYQQINQRRLNAMIKNLSPFILPANISFIGNSQKIFAEKIHTFLTCWIVIRDLKAFGLHKDDINFFEELSLKCLHKALNSENIAIWQIWLLIDELPKLLICKYPVIEDIKEDLRTIIPQLMYHNRMKGDVEGWKNYKRLSYLLELLKM